MENPDNPTRDDTAVTGSKAARLHPQHWNKKALIAVCVVVVLLLIGIAGVFGYHEYAIERDCKAQEKIFTDQDSELTAAVKDARDALASVDASLEVGEGTRLAHTDDFPLSDEGQKAISDLEETLKQAETHEESKAPTCFDSKALGRFKDLTDARQADLDALKAQTTSFTDLLDAYRLAQASEEANSLMDKAKADLAAAQKDAGEQLSVVDADGALQADATVKAAYDALKSVESDSRALSTTVTTSTYEEAVASIDGAKTVADKSAEVTAASQALKDAIQAYRDARAAEEAARAAEAARIAQLQQSNNSGYTPPAPPNNGGGNSGGDDQEIHGCIEIIGLVTTCT